MRVISGTRKGRKLFSPTMTTRPTEDRIKEAIFNILTDIEPGSHVLDVFAGSGGLGIEFLSRGAEKAVFSEISRDNSSVIQMNLDHVDLKDQGFVYTGDFKKNLYQISQTDLGPFDYIFIDPPYNRKDYYKDALDLIESLSLFKKDGIIILESRGDLDLNLDTMECIKEKKYGKHIRLYVLIRRT